MLEQLEKFCLQVTELSLIDQVIDLEIKLLRLKQPHLTEEEARRSIERAVYAPYVPRPEILTAAEVINRELLEMLGVQL
jgi:hypothetical protein